MTKQKPKQKPSPSPSVGDINLIWAVLGLVLVSAIASGFTAWACDYVVGSFKNSNTMALLITDAGVKSDDAKLEGQLTTATQTLIFLRDIGLAVLLGVVGVLVTLAIRFFRPRH